jgi:hypothetical protein
MINLNFLADYLPDRLNFHHVNGPAVEQMAWAISAGLAG